MNALSQCPLCGWETVAPYWRQAQNVNWDLYHPRMQGADSLIFFRCGRCSLILKDPRAWPSPEQERRHYLNHQNDIAEPGYRAFLRRLLEPLVPKLQPGMVGLDFGSGPRPVLAKLCEEEGWTCLSYDPYFAPDERLLQHQYDFITCSEAAEHFHHPAREFARLHSMLKPGGWLALMTRLVPLSFSSWWYHRDPTHVIFFSRETFVWIAMNNGASPTFAPPIFIGDDVILLRKAGGFTLGSRVE